MRRLAETAIRDHHHQHPHHHPHHHRVIFIIIIIIIIIILQLRSPARPLRAFQQQGTCGRARVRSLIEREAYGKARRHKVRSGCVEEARGRHGSGQERHVAWRFGHRPWSGRSHLISAAERRSLTLQSAHPGTASVKLAAPASEARAEPVRSNIMFERTAAPTVRSNVAFERIVGAAVHSNITLERTCGSSEGRPNQFA